MGWLPNTSSTLQTMSTRGATQPLINGPLFTDSIPPWCLDNYDHDRPFGRVYDVAALLYGICSSKRRRMSHSTAAASPSDVIKSTLPPQYKATAAAAAAAAMLVDDEDRKECGYQSLFKMAELLLKPFFSTSWRSIHDNNNNTDDVPATVHVFAADVWDYSPVEKGKELASRREARRPGDTYPLFVDHDPKKPAIRYYIRDAVSLWRVSQNKVDVIPVSLKKLIRTRDLRHILYKAVEQVLVAAMTATIPGLETLTPVNCTVVLDLCRGRQLDPLIFRVTHRDGVQRVPGTAFRTNIGEGEVCCSYWIRNLHRLGFDTQQSRIMLDTVDGDCIPIGLFLRLQTPSARELAVYQRIPRGDTKFRVSVLSTLCPRPMIMPLIAFFIVGVGNDFVAARRTIFRGIKLDTIARVVSAFHRRHDSDDDDNRFPSPLQSQRQFILFVRAVWEYHTLRSKKRPNEPQQPIRLCPRPVDQLVSRVSTYTRNEFDVADLRYVFQMSRFSFDYWNKGDVHEARQSWPFTMQYYARFS